MYEQKCIRKYKKNVTDISLVYLNIFADSKRIVVVYLTALRT